MSTELHWFPFFAKDWLSSAARMAMSPAQRGAYIDLLALAWGNGDAEPCLDPSPEILIGLSGLGRDWKRLSPLILAQFEERDGLLYNAKLSEVWHESQEKHARMVANGKKGGRPKKARGKPGLSVASQNGPFQKATRNQSQSPEEEKTPSEFFPSSPAIALGAEAPRSAEPRLMDETGTTAAPSTISDVLRQLNPRRFALRERPA